MRRGSYRDKVEDLVNYEQFNLDLNEANKRNSDEWKFSYDFANTYGVKDLSVTELLRVWQRLAEDGDLFKTYYRLNTGSHVNPEICDEKCRLTHLCVIANLKKVSVERCLAGDKAGRFDLEKPGEKGVPGGYRVYFHFKKTESFLVILNLDTGHRRNVSLWQFILLITLVLGSTSMLFCVIRSVVAMRKASYHKL